MGQKMKGRELVICADNDRFTVNPDGTPHNTGSEKAFAIAWKLNVMVAVPELHGEVGTDFNDVHVEQGLEAVKKQVEAAMLPADWLLKKSENDKGAAFRTENIKGLAAMKERDPPGFESLRHNLKKLSVRVGALDRAIAGKGDGGGSEEDPKNPEESAAAEIISDQLKNKYAFDKKAEKWLSYAQGFGG